MLNKPSKDELYVAANIPLSGPLAVYGEAIRDGATFALQDLKKENDLKIDWQDNKGDLGTSVSVAKQQLSKKPDIYISGLKPQTQAITNLITEKDISHFTWILDVEINSNSSNNFRTWVNFKKEAEVFLDYAKSRKDLKKVAITYVNLPSAETEYQDIIIPGLKEQGVSDFFIEPFLLNKTDMKDVALKIKQYDPDLLIINGFIPQMVNLTEDLHTLVFDFEKRTIASVDILDAAENLAPQKTEGIIVAAPSFLVNEPQEYIKWKERFEDNFGYKPLYHHAYAYDMALVINQTLESNNGIKNTLTDTNLKGITGTIVFDEDQSTDAQMIPAVYRNGTLQEIK